MVALVGAIIALTFCALTELRVMIIAAVLLSLGFLFLLIFKIPYKRYGILALCGMLFALLYFVAHHLLVFMPMQSFAGQEVIIEGKIDSEYSYNETHKGFIIDADTISYLTETKRVHGKVWVTMAEDAPEYNVAASVRLRAYVFQNPAQRETEITYNKSQQIYLSAAGEEIQLLEDSAPYHPFRMVTWVRAKLRDIYEKYLSTDAAAFVTALTLGDRSFVKTSIITDFRMTGVSHVLAVSGMHLAFVVSIISFLLSLFRIDLRRRSGVVLLCIFAFTALTGFSESALRAAIMLCFYYIGVAIGRENDNYTALSVAVVLCCLKTPFAILSPSLCLSAGATLGMILFSSRFLSLMIPERKEHTFAAKCKFFVCASLSASFAALLGALPWTVYLFKTVSVLSPLTNLLTALGIQILFYLAASLLAFHWIPFLSSALCFFTERFYEYCRWVVSTLSAFPVAALHVQTLIFWIFAVLILLTVVGIGLLYYRKERERRRLTITLILCCAVLCFSAEMVSSVMARRQVNAYFVSVGQGDTTVLVQNSRAALVDCGGEGDGYFNLMDTLQKAGVRSIETIALTHYDRTHYNYALALIAIYGVKTLVLPTRQKYNDDIKQLIRTAKSKDATILYIAEDTDITILDGVKLRALTKHGGRSSGEHQNSLCYRVSFAGTDLLLLGDASGDSHLWMEGYGEEIQADIVKVSSHGAKEGTNSSVLQYIVPTDAIISVGENNEENVPDVSVLDTLSSYCKGIWRTDQRGTIRVTITSDGYKIGV